MDEKTGYAAPAPEAIRRVPNLEKILRRVMEADEARGRSHSLTFVDGRASRITVFPGQDAAPFTFDLPTFIRGQFIASYADWAMLEIERPVSPGDIAREPNGG